MERRRNFSNAPALGSAPLKVVVGKGDGEQTIYIHQDQATRFSDVIAASLKGGFKEAEEGVLRFPEDDPELFKIFATFVYTGLIYSRKPGDQWENKDIEKSRLADLWVLGEKLQASAFKDAVVDAMVERLKSTGTHPLTPYKKIYTNSVGLSGMRRLMVDIAIWGWQMSNLAAAERKDELNEFFFDVAVKLHGLRSSGRTPSPWQGGPPCLYHDHGSGQPCYQALFE